MKRFQSSVDVTDNGVSGFLSYVEDYTGFSDDSALQSGYYLALEVDAPKEAVVTTELVDGDAVMDGYPVDISETKFHVYRLLDIRYEIKFRVTLRGQVIEKRYSLAKLHLNPKIMLDSGRFTRVGVE